ncbi:glycosyltransferase family 4 protein [Paucibacter soli]|uniref:glycosyltransferase family 4 protein n=1 Tax=Paucibacter soli TaxID=3133433 RepID=UPI00309B15B4
MSESSAQRHPIPSRQTYVFRGTGNAMRLTTLRGHSMKIVHLCLSNFFIDDYSYQENMLPKYHALQGHEVTVIASLVSFDSNGKPCLLDAESTKITKDGFKVIRVDYKKPFYRLNRFIRSYKGLASLLANEKPDLIFVHDFSFMDISKVIAYAEQNKQVKIYVDCHTDYINSARTWLSKNVFHHIIWRYYAKLLAPFVDKFYGVTPLRCDFLRDAYAIDPKKIELLVMGVDDEVLKDKHRASIRPERCQALGIDESDLIVTTGGKIDAQKNIHLVMQAMAKLGRPDVKLIVFGTVAPEMQELFDSLLRTDSVIYVGWLNSDEILDYFILSDLVVFPGTHSVLWEQAVGVGTPCIFKYWQGITHVDVGGNCEFLYDDDADEIARIINDVLFEKEKYRGMKKIAMEQGLKKFSYSDIARAAIA